MASSSRSGLSYQVPTVYPTLAFGAADIIDVVTIVLDLDQTFDPSTGCGSVGTPKQTTQSLLNLHHRDGDVIHTQTHIVPVQDI